MSSKNHSSSKPLQPALPKNSYDWDKEYRKKMRGNLYVWLRLDEDGDDFRVEPDLPAGTQRFVDESPETIACSSFSVWNWPNHTILLTVRFFCSADHFFNAILINLKSNPANFLIQQSNNAFLCVRIFYTMTFSSDISGLQSTVLLMISYMALKLLRK